MKPLLGSAPAPYFPAIFGAVLVFILGASVLLGWYTHNSLLIQVSPEFVPMQFNTALGFTLSGLALVAVIAGHRGAGRVCSLLVMLTGLLTLGEYILGIDFGIDQLLMKHYIRVETSHPGRMAPNTALCFLLSGAVVVVHTITQKDWKPSMIAGVLGSLVLALSFIALTGYAVSFEATYGWGGFTRMAVHTAGGFIILGLSLTGLAWHRDISGSLHPHPWLPLAVGIGVLAIMISVWQAHESLEAKLVVKYSLVDAHPFPNGVLLVVGVVLAAAFTLAAYLAQAASHREREVEEANRRLVAEIDERTLTEKALLESEKRLRTIYDHSNDAILLLDVEHDRILDFNHKAVALLEYPPQEFRSISISTIHAHEIDKFKRFTQSIKGPGEGSTEEFNCLTKTGKYVPVEVSASSIEIQGKTYLLAIARDITERKQMEESLRRAQKMDAIGQLSGGIAHDFNNILGIILGNVSLLQARVADDDEAGRRVETIAKAAQRAAELTRQLLGFSRRQATQATATDISRVLDAMAALIVRSLTPQVEVEYRFAQDLWLTEIDPGDFEDALLNLILNARDAMADRGRLTLEAYNCTLDAAYCAVSPGARPGEYVQLVVSDTGEGISVDMQERIFEPFYTSKAEGRGTGLGLAMVYGFVKRSGGYVEVNSELGIGTTFRIYLPRAEGEVQVSEARIEKPQTPPRGSETILVVDDEEVLLELARESLQALGYRVLIAGNGRQALERLAEEPGIELLFSDVVMPGGMSGYELAEEATARRPHLKVLLTSGYTPMAATQNGRSLEANPLAKPYSQEQLAWRVRSLLGEPEAGDENQSDTRPATAAPAVAFVEWTDALSINVPAMDDEHRVLLDLLNRSQQAAANGDEEQCKTLLEQVQDYAQTHLRREEAMMAVCGYPGLDRHRQVHRFLLKQVGKMQRQLDRGELRAGELATFLADWWVDHIQGMDRAYAFYCQDKGELIEQALARAGPAPGRGRLP